MHSRPIHLAVVLLVLLALPAFAAAPNLLKGGGFDTSDDLALWRATSVGTFNDWQGYDGQNRTDSGSASLSGRIGALVQCVPVTGGQAYDFGGRVFVTHTTRRPSAPQAYVQVDYMSLPQCAGPILATDVTTAAVASQNGRFTPLAGHTVAPQFAINALVSLVARDQFYNGSASSAVLFDDIFFREPGGCVADTNTLCLNDRFAVTMTTFDSQNHPIAAPVIQNAPSSGYFYTNSPDDAEVTIKIGSDGQYVIGGMTDLRLQITVRDTTTGIQRNYANEFGHFLSPIVDVVPEH